MCPDDSWVGELKSNQPNLENGEKKEEGLSGEGRKTSEPLDIFKHILHLSKIQRKKIKYEHTKICKL